MSGAGEPQKKPGAKINMEAYQAYYNTNESGAKANGAAVVGSAPAAQTNGD